MRGRKKERGRGRGEKNYACPISLFFWETPYAGKRSSWLVWHREVDWCLSINCKSILFIPFPSVFWNWSGWECRVYCAMRKSEQFLHWSSGQDLLAVLKPTPLLPHAKMLLVPIRFFFFLASRLCSRGRVLCFDSANVILAACFTLRGHDMLIDFLWFLNFWSSCFALWCKSVFFELFWSVKLFSSLNKAVRFFIFVQSTSGSE